MKKKELLIIISTILLVMFIIISFLVFFKTKNSSKNKNQLLDNLTEVGINFYENHYYPSIEDKNILANFNESGVNISLENINVIVSLSDETKNLLDNKKCDYKNTKLSFIPNDPYGVKDYKLKVELACEK